MRLDENVLRWRENVIRLIENVARSIKNVMKPQWISSRVRFKHFQAGNERKDDLERRI
ncbi:phosphoketolase [Bacillus sp. OxB-1]|nr:phosphoketolase [Bacillus sp. OxB-1]